MNIRRKCLMVVAHPDDETIFGGQELFDGEEWHVICLTNAHKVQRANGFHAAMDFAAAGREIWNYPDQPGLSRDPLNARKFWQPFFGEMKARLQAAMETNRYARIVTHNAEGEYGHEHHKMTHGLVRDAFPGAPVDVFSIGRHAIPAPILRRKLAIMAIYGSQITVSERMKFKPWVLHGTTRPAIP